MTSSGVKTQESTLIQIISDAYHEAGITHIGQTPSAPQLSKGRRKLNRMVSEWMKLPGERLWTWKEGILFLQRGQNRYQLGSSSTDHFTDAYDFASTTLSSGAAAAATALSVASISGIANADYLGIELDTGYFQWTTVNGAPSGTTVTAATGLTSAASSGNRVIAYTTKLIRPLEIKSSRHYNYGSQTEISVRQLSHVDYMELPNRTTEASPFVQSRYQPDIPLGIFEVWNRPANVDYAARFTYKRPIFDFTDNAETADFPVEWENALVFGLAVELIPSGNVPESRAAILVQMASAKLALAMNGDREPVSILFQPDMEE